MSPPYAEAEIHGSCAPAISSKWASKSWPIYAMTHVRLRAMMQIGLSALRADSGAVHDGVEGTMAIGVAVAYPGSVAMI